MTSIESAPAISRGALWTGRVLSTLCILFLVFDAVAHIVKPAPVIDAFNRLGFPLSLAAPIGVLELVCVAVYAFPPTAALGAVLLTGYLGGAIATNLRAGSPMFAETLFPVYFGIALWAGLILRDRRVLELVPPRRAK
ncbi:MAG TPA: DoxX family protein [Gemmatimonadaceae bacterium]|jgi:hypothetical protein|nr:DoxX family protein [Gemmatimonadaceae bacterium]